MQRCPASCRLAVAPQPPYAPGSQVASEAGGAAPVSRRRWGPERQSDLPEIAQQEVVVLRSKQRPVSCFQAVSQRGGDRTRAALGGGPLAPWGGGQEASLQLLAGHIYSA